jgi:hypothetical protein
MNSVPLAGAMKLSACAASDKEPTKATMHTIWKHRCFCSAEISINPSCSIGTPSFFIG